MVKEYAYVLDSQDVDKLEKMWRHIADHPIVAARELFPEKPDEFVMTTKMIGSLAFLRSSAIKMRLTGHIESAKHYVDAFENIYRQLPEYAKW